LPKDQNNTYLPGDTVDNAYQLTKLLGTGGMGVVYSCKHLVLQKAYALKILMSGQLESEAWARFKIEAKALAKLNHPGIVGIHNMGIDKGVSPYYVMDLLSGESLDVIIRDKGPLPTSDALKLFAGVADALASAHAHGIIHRDIKPSNLMLVRDPSGTIDQPKIVDFGIARLTNKGGHNMQSQTATGVVFGTPFYMSPEQCRGDRVDERSDIYSFGCTLFEVLTGRPPLVGKNAFDTIMMHMTDNPPSLSTVREDVEFPEALEELIEKTLSKELSDRYQNMGQLKHDLERVIAGKAVMRRGSRSTTLSDTGRVGSVSQQMTIPEFDYNSQRQTSSQRESNRYLNRDLQINTSIDYGENDDKEQSPFFLHPRLLLTALLALGLGIGAYFVYEKYASHQTMQTLALTQTKHTVDEDPETLGTVLTEVVSMSVADKGEMVKTGATQAEIDRMVGYDWLKYGANEKKYKTLCYEYLRKTNKPGVRFMHGNAYYLPSDFYIFALKFGDKPPFNPAGITPIPPGQEVCVYLNEPSENYPEILDRFGPDELTGLEFKLRDSAAALSRIKSWTRLKDLVFFNSLTKALPRHESDYDETRITDKDLPSLESFKLRTLGLCGSKITGSAIIKMPMIHTLQSLKVKRISDLNSLMHALPGLDNLKEIWLLAQNTRDEDLEPLTKMKNLESLRIRRSQLTPDSVQYFLRMPALKHLCLDRNWTDAEKKEFQNKIPFCQFESVTNEDFWQFFPKQAQ